MTLSKNEIKRIKALSQKKFRDETGLFICEGEKLVAEALRSGLEVEAAYYKDEIGEEAMSRITCLATPSPALAVVKMPQGRGRATADEALRVIKGTPSGILPALFLALDGIRDPGNAGTILRIADWFGIEAVFASGGSVDIYNPKTVQASMGAIFRVKFLYTDINALCSLLKQEGIPVFGTFLEGENIYSADLSLHGPALVVMGSEADGITAETAAFADRRLLIPPFGKCGAESLNVAVATAVICSEFRRR